MKEATEETRRKTNPLYNDRKLKLGTFSTNLGADARSRPWTGR